MEAMENMDLDNLRRTIKVAEERGVDSELITAAHAREEVVVQMVAARDELMAALRSFSAERLQVAMERAEELELDEFLSEETLDNVVARFQFLEQRDKAADALRMAIESNNLTVVQDALYDARIKHCDDSVIKLGERRVAELQDENLDAEAAVIAATENHNITALEGALEEAERLTGGTIRASIIQAGETRLADLRRRGEAQEELEIAMEDVDLMVLRQKIARAEDLGVFVQSPELLTRANARIDEIQDMMTNLLSVLAAAVVAEHDGTHRRTNELVDALAEVERLHCVRDGDQITDATVSKAEARLATLRDLDQATDAVIAIYDSEDMGAVSKALSRAKSVGVVQPVIDRGDEAFHRVQILLRDTRQLLIDLTEGADTTIDALQHALDESNRLRAASAKRIHNAEERLAALRAR